MTSVERMTNILKRKPVDRIGIFEHFWDDTYKSYVAEGWIPDGEKFEDHFNLDMQLFWPVNLKVDIDFVNQIISETEDTMTVLDGNGATLKRHKKHDTTPEHIDFKIKSRKEWEEAKPLLTSVIERRINFEGYRLAKEEARRANRFFAWASPNVFEFMHPIAGHENMLIGMGLDPDWVVDMVETYSDMIVTLQEILFDREGKPDGIFYYDDLGFKEKPFISPSMYEEIIQPGHKKTFDYAHSQGLPVILHSCGFVEPLLPKMIEAGIDCLQVIEIKAGMDLLRIHQNFGDVISLMGGIDVRALYTNDKAIIDKELESKIPIVKKGFGYTAHSDHSIPKTVNYETLRYYFDKCLELGRY